MRQAPMSLIDTIRRQVVPIHPEGYIFIALFGIAALLLHWLWAPAGWLEAIATLWCVYFFRDPPRVTPLRDGLVVAPADGLVVSIADVPPPRELAMGDAPMRRIGIFLNVFDVHINRIPLSGIVTATEYHKG